MSAPRIEPTPTRPDDDDPTTEGGMSVALVSVLAALAVVAGLIWTVAFHMAGSTAGAHAYRALEGMGR